MDVCLTKYGHCNYVSGKHACIFYDEVSNTAHILNVLTHYSYSVAILQTSHSLGSLC